VNRYAFLLLVSALLFMVTWWLSEDLFFPVEQLRALHLDRSAGWVAACCLLIAGLAAIGSAILWRRGWSGRLSGATLLIAATAAAGYIGGHCASTALNDCVASSEQLRAALAGYQHRTGSFPATLEQLGAVPCKRCLRGTIVTYKSDGKTYDISFGDWLVSWHGTDREPVTPIK
jgi:hypothetical protein